MAYTATYSAGDLGTMIVDIIGGAFNAMVPYIGPLIILSIVIVLAGLAMDALTGIFGIVKKRH